MDQLQSAIRDRYTLEREIGEGGMANVFLANDVRHARRVAVKVLKPELGAMLGAERFLSEIRVTANLQHPHLLPLFDSGEADGLLYYVMPFVDGETLRARLDREGQLPVGDAVRIGVAVASALEHAHRHGIIHRDLKPENILLQDGLPLVADFGIALAVSRAGGARVTATGMSLGTPQYMSPEQAAADRTVDGRSDIYALGAVLYEMLTGEAPHTGSTLQAIVARVITEEPRAIHLSRPSVPAELERIVMRALEKLPADRFESAREFAAALSAVPLTTSGGHQSSLRGPARDARPAVGRRRTIMLASGAMLAIIAAGVAGWVWSGRRGAAPPATARFSMQGFPDQTGSMTLTPDGRNVLYVATSAGQSSIRVRRIDELTWRVIPLTEGAQRLFASPDGQWVGFISGDDKLKKVPIEGGTPTVFGQTFRFATATWGANNVVVTDGATLDGLSWISADGGAMHPLTRLDTAARESSHFGPYVLPDGKGVLFALVKQSRGVFQTIGELAYVPLDTTRTTPATHIPLGLNGRYVVGLVDGWLLFGSEDRSRIDAIRFDPSTGRTSGKAVTVLQQADVRVDDAKLSADGTLLYTARGSSSNEAKRVDAKGVATSLVGAMADGPYMNPRLSPDGRRLAIQGTSPQGDDIWIYDIASRARTRLTLTGNALGPAWTPDGKRLLFMSTTVGKTGFWWVPADGSAPAEKLFDGGGIVLSETVLADGRTLLFQQQDKGIWSIWTASLPHGTDMRPVVKEDFDNYMPALSPDGHTLAYASNASGRYEIYVRPFPGTGVATMVSDSGGTEPKWRSDSRALYYRNRRGFTLAELATTPALSVTSRAVLFADTFTGLMPHANFDILPAANSFVMIASDATSTSQVIVVNWLTELRARLAAGR
ncbi:MAG: protein kinase [Gemmatimonadaceae bacterium]